MTVHLQWKTIPLWSKAHIKAEACLVWASSLALSPHWHPFYFETRHAGFQGWQWQLLCPLLSCWHQAMGWGGRVSMGAMTSEQTFSGWLLLGRVDLVRRASPRLMCCSNCCLLFFLKKMFNVIKTSSYCKLQGLTTEPLLLITDRIKHKTNQKTNQKTKIKKSLCVFRRTA